MPGGMSWPRYLTFVTAAFLSMAAGSQVVHNIYEPFKDLPEYVERERARLKALKEETDCSER